MATKKANEFKKELTEKEEEIFGRWTAARDALTSAKQEESEARADMLAIFYPEGITHVGTQNWLLPANFVLTVTGNMGMKVDETQFDAVLMLLNTPNEEGVKPGIDPDTGEVISLDGPLRAKYEVNMTEYKKLTNEQRACFAAAITMKPESPTIKFEQKAAKAPVKAIGTVNPFDN